MYNNNWSFARATSINKNLEAMSCWGIKTLFARIIFRSLESPHTRNPHHPTHLAHAHVAELSGPSPLPQTDPATPDVTDKRPIPGQESTPWPPLINLRLGYVLSMFLYFWKFELQHSYKQGSYSKKSVYVFIRSQFLYLVSRQSTDWFLRGGNIKNFLTLFNTF